MLKQHIYILMLHHTLLHDFGSTQERLPHNQINLLSQSGQVLEPIYMYMPD